MVGWVDGWVVGWVITKLFWSMKIIDNAGWPLVIPVFNFRTGGKSHFRLMSISLNLCGEQVTSLEEPVQLIFSRAAVSLTG